VTDGRTEGQTDRHRATPYAALCIASRGKSDCGYRALTILPMPYLARAIVFGRCSILQFRAGTRLAVSGTCCYDIFNSHIANAFVRLGRLMCSIGLHWTSFSYPGIDQRLRLTAPGIYYHLLMPASAVCTGV